MAEAERIACASCGKWMFHLAKTCPHCGAVNGGGAATPAPDVGGRASELKLSADEARALLAATTPGGAGQRMNLAQVATELISAKRGAADWVLSVIAAPLTTLTVLTLGYFLLRQRRAARDEVLAASKALAVPTATLFWVVTMVEFEVPSWGWVLTGVSFAAWLVRAILRAVRSSDPLS